MNPSARSVDLRPADTLRSEALRYLLVGGIAFGLDYTLLVVLTELAEINYLVSAVVAFAAGLTANYCLCTTYVFSGRSLSSRRAEFALFALIGVVGLGLTEWILWCGEEWIGLDYRFAKLIAVAVVLAWNFGARRAVLFRPSRRTETTHQ